MTSKEITHVKQLVHDPRNARIHTEKNIAMLVAGLQEVGAGRSILIDGKGEIIAGNGVVEAATAAGITRVRVIDTDGDEIIAVRRKNLSGRQKTRAALLDNRAQETSSWNTDVLKDMAHSDVDALKGLWEDEELDFLLNSMNDLHEETLSPISDETKPEESGIERIVLWIASEKHPSFLANIRQLGERIGRDDVGEVIIHALEVATGTHGK